MIAGVEILMDLDGVLVNFVQAALDAVGRVWPYDDLKSDDPRVRWDLPTLVGMTDGDFWRQIDACGDAFWTGMNTFPDAAAILELAERAVGEENVCLLSAPSANPQCAAAKLAWIKQRLPRYARRYLLGPAKRFCAAPRRILIDDSDKNVDAFRKAGGLAVLVPRPWNSLWKTADAVEHVSRELSVLLGEFMV